MEEITAEIKFIKIALGSFVGNPDESERQNKLLSRLSSITNDENLKEQLRGYIRLSEAELKEQWKFLQEKELKSTSSVGNLHLFHCTFK